MTDNNKLNFLRGLNRLWILLTIIWFIGVLLVIWTHAGSDPCAEKVSAVHATYGDKEYLQHIPQGCGMFDDLPYDYSKYFLYIVRTYAWTILVPFAAWFLGFGLLWVAKGFRSQKENQ
jgi:hypothetical protein